MQLRYAHHHFEGSVSFLWVCLTNDILECTGRNAFFRQELFIIDPTVF